MQKGKMIILPGNSGEYEDEDGTPKNYVNGALHQRAAEEFARWMDYEPDLIPIRGQDYRQVTAALEKLNSDSYSKANSPVFGLYGFSGGGYHVRHILEGLKLDKSLLERLKLVVVIGSPPTRPEGKKWPICRTTSDFKLARSEFGLGCRTFKTDFEAAKFSGGNKNIDWQLMYYTNPDPKGHMFGPDWLLRRYRIGDFPVDKSLNRFA